MKLTVELGHRLPVLFWLNLFLFVFLFVGEKGCQYFSFFLGERLFFLPKFLLQGKIYLSATSLWWKTVFFHCSPTPLLPPSPASISPLFLFRKGQASHEYKQSMAYQVEVELISFLCIKAGRGNH